MTVKRFVSHGAALAVLGLALGLAGPLPGPTAIPAAQAQGISISIGTFYDRLAPYGEWVSYHGRYVWVPTRVGPGWKPYVVGHWAYTEPYGWMWVSDEPYAWAVYHYGRWGFDPAVGWFWVPDTVWGPAWVDWRQSDEDVAWAPLPPTTIGVSFGPQVSALPVNYWVAVPVTNFLAPNLSVHVVYRDHDRLDRILKRTRSAGRVKVENNIVINNVINVNFIEKKTKKKVVVRKVEKVTKADQSGKVKGDEIAVFAPTVEKKGDAKPKRVRNLEEVVKERREKQPKEAAIEERATDRKARKAKGTVEEEPVDKKARKAKATVEEEPVDKKARKAKGTVVEEEPVDKKARKARATTEQPSEEISGQKARKSQKARATQEPAQPAAKAEQRQKKQKTGLTPGQDQGSDAERRSGGKKAERQAKQRAEQKPAAAQGGGEQQQKKKKKKQEQATD